MCRVPRVFLIVAAMTWACSAADQSPFNVDFFPGWDGHYRPMEWMPVEIGIAGELTQPFSGTLTVSTTQDGLNTLNISHQFVLTPDLPIHAPLVTKQAFAADKCVVRLFDERGRVQWRQTYDTLDFSGRTSAMIPVGDKDLLVGLVGSAGFGLLQIGNETVCSGGPQAGQVYLATKVPRMMPWDWTGYVCLDLLILCDPDWGLFNSQQLEAICQWVSGGGRLLLVLGGRAVTPSNPIARMLPLELSELHEMTLPADVLRAWRLDSSATENVAARSMKPVGGSWLHSIPENYQEPALYAAAPVGFGMVGVLGLDPRQFSAVQRSRAAAFWVEIIKPLLASRIREGDPAAGGPFLSLMQPNERDTLGRTIIVKSDAPPMEDNPDAPYFRQMYQIGPGWNATNMVMEHLYNIPQMRPLSIWWVILLLVSLAMLLGPVDYLLLKRYDRLPLTWLTSAGWIILFTVGAYYGVQALRGGKMQLRTVSVCDSMEGSPYAWNTAYVGLFAPHSGDFQIEGLGDRHWWSAVAPTQESIWVYNQEAGRREVSCLQHDGANLPYSLPISIWTIQCLMGEWADMQAPFEAAVSRRGDEISLTIDNRSDRPIRRGFIAFDKDRGIELPRIDARKTEQIQGRLAGLNVTRQLRGYASQQSYHDPYTGYSQTANVFSSAVVSHGCLRRTQAVDACLARRAAVVCVEYDGPPAAFAVRKHSHESHHICLARRVVFPIEDNEGANP